jgi:hypothetical protein
MPHADHKYVRPRAIRTEEIVDSLADDYFYLGCIKFINKVKTGSLVEHSPMLVDISGVRTWAKVNQGMLRMYRVRLSLNVTRYVVVLRVLLCVRRCDMCAHGGVMATGGAAGQVPSDAALPLWIPACV